MVRYILLLIIAGIVGGIIAGRKGRNPIWCILSALFPLLIIVLAALPPLVSKGYIKKCIYCAELIKEDAIVCKYCGREQPIEMIKVQNKM